MYFIYYKVLHDYVTLNYNKKCKHLQILLLAFIKIIHKLLLYCNIIDKKLIYVSSKFTFKV
jgi:hypothetical protein